MGRCEGKRLRSCCGEFLHFIRRRLLRHLLISGVIVSFTAGSSARKSVMEIEDPEKKATTIMLIRFPGELFMNMLKLLILPLIVTSLITALATLDSKAMGRIGRRTVLYYMGTMLIAVLLGIVLVLSIRPGERSKPSGTHEILWRPYRGLDSLLDLLRSCFPVNLVEATFIQKRTKYKTVDPVVKEYNETIRNGTHNYTVLKEEELAPGSSMVPAGLEIASRNMNVLGLVVFSIVFGIVLGRVGKRGLPMKAFIESLNEIIMKMVSLVMWLSPIGTCSLIIANYVGMHDSHYALKMLGYIMGTAIAGLLCHGFIILPLVYLIFTRKNPIIYIKNMLDAILTAYGTDSSAATLPTTMRCVEQNNHVDKRISRFVLPLGATVNVDGTVLYEGVCVLCIAQLHGISLGAGQVIIIILTSMTGAANPSAGLVTMLIVLQSANLPTGDVALLWAVDWFMDRIRTVVNVLGDAIGAGIVGHLSRDELKNADQAGMEEGGQGDRCTV